MGYKYGLQRKKSRKGKVTNGSTASGESREMIVDRWFGVFPFASLKRRSVTVKINNIIYVQMSACSHARLWQPLRMHPHF